MLIRGKLATLCVAVAICGLGGCADDPAPDVPGNFLKVPITTSSEEARAAYLEGRELLEGLHVAESNGHFQKATELDPTFALAWMSVAYTAATAPELFAALRNAAAGIEGVSEGERMLIEAFEAGVNQEPEIQRTNLEALVAAYPNDERAHNELAIFLGGQQEFDQAIKEYRAAISINPGFSPAHNQLGYALRTVGDYCGAEEAFKKYTALIPDQPNPYDSYAELLMKMGRFQDSISMYERALTIDPHFVTSHVGICNNRIFMGDFSGARAALVGFKLVARNDGERRAVHTWSAVSYLHENNFESALEELQLRYDIAAESDDRAAMAMDLQMMGNVLLRAGRHEMAGQRFVAAVEKIGESDATDDIKEAVRRNHPFDLARTALWKGDLATAAELASAYRKAVAVPDIRMEVQQSHELDAMLALAEGDYKSALFELANANQQDPQVILLTARAFEAAGDLDAAYQACKKVVDFNQLSINLAFVRNTAIDLMGTL